jgi:GntR family transcriptional regulator
MNVENESNKVMIPLSERLRNVIMDTLPGNRLPSEPKLAKQLGVSRATLREAMRSFETQGIIHRKQGVGTFVIHPKQIIETGLEVLESIHTVADRIGLPVKVGWFESEIRLPSDEERAHLEIENDGKVLQVCWVMEADNRPVAYLVDVLPEDIISEKLVEQDFKGSVLDLLQYQERLPLGTSRSEISAVAATAKIAKSLGVQRRAVLLNFISTLYTIEGRPIDYSYSYFIPGYFNFHVVRRVGSMNKKKHY